MAFLGPLLGAIGHGAAVAGTAAAKGAAMASKAAGKGIKTAFGTPGTGTGGEGSSWGSVGSNVAKMGLGSQPAQYAPPSGNDAFMPQPGPVPEAKMDMFAPPPPPSTAQMSAPISRPPVFGAQRPIDPQQRRLGVLDNVQR